MSYIQRMPITQPSHMIDRDSGLLVSGGVPLVAGERGRERVEVQKTHLVPFRIFPMVILLTLFGKWVRIVKGFFVVVLLLIVPKSVPLWFEK